MIDVDTSWMASSARSLFDQAVRAFAEAIRSGSVPAMQSAQDLMRQASQAQIMAEENLSERGTLDPEI